MRKILLLFSIVYLFSSDDVLAQRNKGQFIVASEYPKAIIYIDTMRFVGHGTGLLAPGNYKVKAWRLGTELYESEIRIKNDSVSILKIRFTDTKEYSTYKQRLKNFRLKKWTPNLLLLGYFSKLLFDLKHQRDLGEREFKNYETNYASYQNANTQSNIDKYKSASLESYTKYQTIYNHQQKIIKQLKYIPWITAGIVVFDFMYKRPARYTQEPLLTFHVGSNFSNYYSVQLAYTF